MSIATQNVCWGAGGKMIVDGVTISAAPGTTLGLIGPNGSGKSSLLRLIGGLRKVASGVVTLGGTDIRDLARIDIARRTAFVEQQVDTEERLTIEEVVRLGRAPHRGALDAWTQCDQEAVETALRHVDLTHRRRQFWHTLSGGERQRTQIARALAQCPSELLLDEPTNHLDAQHQLEILRLVAHLPVTSIVALHDLNLAAMFCDQIAVLRAGRVVTAGAPADVLNAALIRDVFGVEAVIGHSPFHDRPHVFLAPVFLAPARAAISAGERSATTAADTWELAS